MYFDYAASTPVSDSVVKKLNQVLPIYGNPSSLHTEGQAAKEYIVEATNIISSKINCDYSEIHYTSGATMSNNIIIQGFLRANRNGIILYSAIEHNDIIMMANYFGEEIFKKINVDNLGKIDVAHLKNLLELYKNVPVLVTIQGANSEIGTVQDLEMISKLIHLYSNAYFHSDLTQYIAFYKCNVKKIKLDAFSMSGQKINCIKGIGLAYISNNFPIHPLIFGEQGLIGGTENVLGISCLGTAFNELDYDYTDLINKRDRFINKINRPIVGSLSDRLPNNLCCIFKNRKAEEFVELLNEFNISVSAGSACSSGSPEPSHVLKEIGLSDDEAMSCIRFTIGKNTTYEEINKACDLINKICNLGL